MVSKSGWHALFYTDHEASIHTQIYIEELLALQIIDYTLE